MMLRARLLAYVTGTVNQELLLRNEYLAAENRILRGQILGRHGIFPAPKRKRSSCASESSFTLVFWGRRPSSLDQTQDSGDHGKDRSQTLRQDLWRGFGRLASSQFVPDRSQ